MNLGAPELLIILAVVLLLFGGAKLPKLARSLGEAQKEFKKGMDHPESPEAQAVQAQQAQQAPATQAQQPPPQGPIS